MRYFSLKTKSLNYRNKLEEAVDKMFTEASNRIMNEDELGALKEMIKAHVKALNDLYKRNKPIELQWHDRRIGGALYTERSGVVFYEVEEGQISNFQSPIL